MRIKYLHIVITIILTFHINLSSAGLYVRGENRIDSIYTFLSFMGESNDNIKQIIDAFPLYSYDDIVEMYLGNMGIPVAFNTTTLEWEWGLPAQIGTDSIYVRRSIDYLMDRIINDSLTYLLDKYVWNYYYNSEVRYIHVNMGYIVLCTEVALEKLHIPMAAQLLLWYYYNEIQRRNSSFVQAKYLYYAMACYVYSGGKQYSGLDCDFPTDMWLYDANWIEKCNKRAKQDVELNTYGIDYYGKYRELVYWKSNSRVPLILEDSTMKAFEKALDIGIEFSDVECTLTKAFALITGSILRCNTTQGKVLLLSIWPEMNESKLWSYLNDKSPNKNVWIDSLPLTCYFDSIVSIAQTDYDILDRPIATHWADGAESSISYGIGDDAFGVSRLLQNRTDENGNEWQQYTSPQGWLTTSIAPDEATTTFRYDALGQLLQSTDPDGLTTTHTYDGFGRRTKRVHPDAGITRWTYDAAGNMIASATNLQLNRGEQTTYEYNYTRPVHIHYPQYPQNDVYYTYDSVGRLAMVQDVTGTERMEYDAMGNVSLSERTIAIPTELTAYRFATHFSYDAFGRMQQITYPDGEVVNYHYSNGLLHYVDGSASAPYIQSIDYDEYDAPIYIQYGNGLTSDIAYDDVRRWTVARSLRDENNDYLQDISYHYDNVGNITQIEQDAPPYDNMGGEYMVTYTYDDQYRLIDAAQRNSFVGNYDYTMAYSPSGVVDTKYSPETGTDITFGYTQGYNNSAFYSHQPQMAYSSTEEDIMMFRWDWNGQLTHIGRPYTEQFRRHVWNEAGQLAAVFGNEYCGYYAYDAKGNRAYKITGYVVEDQHNAGYPSYTAYFDDATMYVNPYMVVIPLGYTKHYYNGSQRIASRLGDYWELEDPSVDAEDELAVADSLWLHTTTIIEPDHQDMEGDYQYIQADGSNLPIVSYGPYISSIRGSHAEDILWGVFSGSSRADDGGMTDDGVFYYHPDHLGSATWITSDRGHVVQYLHYMPLGELWESQQVSEYDERFKFTGKERDTETGYDYFGARYYLSLLGIWLSPDPLLDEYPEISSYAYCKWNPINRLDPDGRDWVYQEDGSKYMWRDDITENSDMPKGLQYVGAQANDILYHMGLSSQYETQSDWGLSLGTIGGDDIMKGILGVNITNLEATVGISVNCAIDDANISDNNRTGLTFTGITVNATGVTSSKASSSDLLSNTYGALKVYTNGQTFSGKFAAPEGQYMAPSGVIPKSARINIPASAVTNGNYIQAAKLSLGAPNQNVIFSINPKLQWNLQTRTFFR